MNAIMGTLHTIGYLLVLGAAIWSIIVLMRSAEEPMANRMLLLARIEETGIGLLWLSGIIMVWSVIGGPKNLPSIFWAKMASALLVTLCTILFATASRQRAEGQSVRGRMLLLNWIATGFVILAAIFQAAVFYSISPPPPQ